MLDKLKNMVKKKKKNKDQEHIENQETNGAAQDEILTESAEGVEESGDSSVVEEGDMVPREELSQLNDKFLRLLAEFENYKRRTAKEKLELKKTASRDIVSDLLDVLDDFDRASKSVPEEMKGNSTIEGFQLVHHKLLRTLTNKGLQEMESTGVDFDADLHEAITEVPAPDDSLKGKVIDTVEKGYLLNDVIIRYAKVVVGK